MENKFYCYIYLDPRKPGRFSYGNFVTFFYEPFYVGKGNGKRIYDHLKDTKLSKSNMFRYNKIKKIINEGKDIKLYVVKIIEDILEESAFELEKSLVSIIGRFDKNNGPLTNLTDGGDGSKGYICSEETKNIISKKLKGKKKPIRSEEHKLNMSLSKRGIPAPPRNKEHYTKAVETKRLNNILKCKEETKEKISKANKGKKPWNKGLTKENSEIIRLGTEKSLLSRNKNIINKDLRININN